MKHPQISAGNQSPPSAPPLNPILLSTISPTKSPIHAALLTFFSGDLSMGCGDSRPQLDGEIPAGLRPFWRRLQQLKRSRMEDLRRRRRERKDDGGVSTADIFRSVQTKAVMEEAGWKAAAEEDGGRLWRELTAEEEMPGSPSFRFYLTDVGKGTHVNPFRSNHQEKLREIKEKTNESI